MSTVHTDFNYSLLVLLMERKVWLDWRKEGQVRERGRWARGCARGPWSSGQDTGPTAQWGRASSRAQTTAALAPGRRGPHLKESTEAPVASSWPPLQPPAQRWWDPQAGQRIPLPSNRPLTARASKLIGQWFNCFKVQSVKLRTMTLSGLGLSLQANQIIYFSLKKKKRWGKEGGEMGRWQKKYKTWKELPETQFFVPAE